MSKVYFHVDLNAFFASAEVLLNPELKGKPIAVSYATRRSVVSTASYEARKYGVHSAMPIGQAKTLCKDLIIVEPHFHYYEELSAEFMDILKSYTSIYEQASIDECYLDVTKVIQTYARPLDLAWTIQRRIHQELGLCCSVGVAPNLFLAKMASDYKKPMGITVMRIREVPQKLWPLAIEEMRGVGAKTVPLLKDLGIQTIGDLANYKDIESLRPIFGKNTEMIIQRAHGKDSSEIEMDVPSKSMGVSETLLEDITDYDEIRGFIRTLSRRLSTRLQEEQKAGSVLSLKIRYYDFSTMERSKKLSHPIYLPEDLFHEAIQLFDDHYEEEPVRLIGITVSDFASKEWVKEQLNLFDETNMREEETARILQDLNRELGRNSFVLASTLQKKDSICK